MSGIYTSLNKLPRMFFPFSSKTTPTHIFTFCSVSPSSIDYNCKMEKEPSAEVLTLFAKVRQKTGAQWMSVKYDKETEEFVIDKVKFVILFPYSPFVGASGPRVFMV